MLLSDSQIIMRPLYSNLLFKPIDYIFATCLTKCLSWLVGVQSSPYSSNYICIIILLLPFTSKSVTELWVVTWVLGLKKWHKSWSRRHMFREKSHQTHAYLVVRAFGASQMHPCPYRGSVQGFDALKV